MGAKNINILFEITFFSSLKCNFFLYFATIFFVEIFEVISSAVYVIFILTNNDNCKIVYIMIYSLFVIKNNTIKKFKNPGLKE